MFQMYWVSKKLIVLSKDNVLLCNPYQNFEEFWGSLGACPKNNIYLCRLQRGSYSRVKSEDRGSWGSCPKWKLWCDPKWLCYSIVIRDGILSYYVLRLFEKFRKLLLLMFAFKTFLLQKEISVRSSQQFSQPTSQQRQQRIAGFAHVARLHLTTYPT